LERDFETITCEAPELAEKTIPITGDYLRQRLAEAAKDEDLSKFILLSPLLMNPFQNQRTRKLYGSDFP